MTLKLGRAEIKIEKKGHVRRRAKPPTKKREKLRTAVPADTATAGPKRTTTVGPAETNTAPSSTSPAQCPAVDSQRLEHIAASTTNPTLNTTDAHAKPLNPMVELDQWENYIIILAIIVRFILAILDMLLHSISVSNSPTPNRHAESNQPHSHSSQRFYCRKPSTTSSSP